jgi:hypothetical protein
MVVQPPQNQVTPSQTNGVNRPASEYRSEGLGIPGPTQPAERLLDIAVGEVKSDDRSQARARRDHPDGREARPERFFSASDEPVIRALIAENRLVPRGSFVNVVI